MNNTANSPLSYHRYEEIKTSVIDALEECRNITVPINPFLIAKELFYTIIPYSQLPLEKYGQAIQISNDAYSQVCINPVNGLYEGFIFFNDYCRTQCRILWSIAHEIGHLYLGHHSLAPSAVEEAEANFFAKYLLAPPPLISRYNCSSAQDIANNFGLSHEASIYAYAYYLKWLKSSPYFQPEEERLLKIFSLSAYERM